MYGFRTDLDNTGITGHSTGEVHQEFKTSVSYIAGLRTAWAETLSLTQKNVGYLNNEGTKSI